MDERALEIGADTAAPVDHVVEWLAEWGREVRRRQRGLLLSTAHRAKGLEFDHVVVLDGGWDRVGENEDPDAPRRLYYVAMTRARQTLALARLAESGVQGPFRAAAAGQVRESAPAYAAQVYALHQSIADSPAVLQHTADGLPRGSAEQAAELARRYRRLGLDDVHVGFAGRYGARHPLHRAIAALAPGDPLEVQVAGHGPWKLLDREGLVVGRLARKFEPPAGMRCVAAAVHAVVAWSREASEPEFQGGTKCDRWEVVVPELVFEPDGGSHGHDRSASGNIQ